MRCDCDWCPNIPNDWKQVRLKDIAILKSGDSFTADELSDDEENYPVYGGNGLRGYTEKYNKDGDYVLLGRQGALCGNINYAHGKFFATEHALVVNTYKKLNTTWLGETLRCADYNRLSQSAAQPGLAASVLMNQFIPFPPEVVRERIGSYLDHKTAKIDHAVSLLQKKRDAYTRLKASIINRAVTCGLNHNVKLKDSGVDWIGMIPENWEVRRIKDVGFMKSGDVIRKEQLEDDGKYCVYGANSLIGHSNMFNVNGNVLTIGRVGSCGVVRQIVEPTFISDNALILYNIRGCINYMFFTLKSAKLERLNESIAQPLITATKVKGVFIPYPPLPEQQIIASYLDTHCSRIDHAISIVDKQIDAYTRLKKSLINEVVTGKRKV